MALKWIMKNIVQDFLHSDEDIIAALEQIEDDLAEKAQNLLIIKQRIENDVDALDKEIKRLQALQKSRKAGIASIEDRIKWEMKNSGINLTI